MEIAIIGCSHCAGEYGKSKINRKNSWANYFSKLYPQHNFHIYTNPGMGYDVFEYLLHYIYKEKKYDIVLLQLTTTRQTLATDNFDFMVENLSDNLTFFQPKITGTKFSTRHFDDNKNPSRHIGEFSDKIKITDSTIRYFFDKETENTKNVEDFLKIYFENNWFINHDEQLFIETLPMYKKIFKNFFYFSWYYNIKNDFGNDCVSTFFTKKISKDMNVDLKAAKYIYSRRLYPGRGHLPFDMQCQFLENFLLEKNKNFIELLDS